MNRGLQIIYSGGDKLISAGSVSIDCLRLPGLSPGLAGQSGRF